LKEFLGKSIIHPYGYLYTREIMFGIGITSSQLLIGRNIFRMFYKEEKYFR